MIDKLLEQDILNYTFSEETHKFMSGRCAKSILQKRGWYDYLINRYTDNSIGSIIEILYRIKNNLDEIPKCKICGSPLKFTNGIQIIVLLSVETMTQKFLQKTKKESQTL